jgi:hypothetical protein
MDDRPELVRLSPGRGPGRGLMGVVAVAILTVVVIGSGFIGNLGREPVAPTPPRASARAATAAPSAAPSEKAVVDLAHVGYRVRFEADPQLYDEDTFAIYGRGFDVVTVAVGTPLRGASLLGEGIATRIYAGTLDRLGQAYLAATPFTVTGGDEITIDGYPARLLSLGRRAEGQARAVTALALVGNRAFVISSSDRATLDGFLAGFTFGPKLFVSRELGFLVPEPVSDPPFGVTVGTGEAVTGLWVFDDGSQLDPDTWSHGIAVAVGTETRPALVRSLPSALPPPSPRRMWAATLPELVRLYRRLVDVGDGLPTVPTTLGGVDAALVIRADGLAATILAVRDGRNYIVSTSGNARPERAPHFDQFVEAFTFLE